MPNRLAAETSPYLLQHRDNPVDWYPWGAEALSAAAGAGKPLLVSIGYSACHWCHVMERESFEDAVTAEVMNEHFVCIKIDREERPDIDAVYMDFVQALTGHGGWPMTVFATPEGKPFYGGTYFPPDDRHGLPSFRRVLSAVAEAWSTRREEVAQQAERLTEHLREATRVEPGDLGDRRVLMDGALETAASSFDRDFGGFGQAPKFPQPMLLDLLLAEGARGRTLATEMAEKTLEAMAAGGMFDQLGGGFARYSVDRSWTVPHFEKMLYDNAQLLRTYARAWLATRKPRFLEVARATAMWMLGEMRDPAGGFWSSLDADSEGEEGRFYVWTLDEVVDATGDLADTAVAAWGFTADGNFEGKNIPVWTGWEDTGIESARARLLAARERRVRPATDDKVLLAWSSLAAGALADAATILDEPEWREAAVSCMHFLRSTMRVNGRFHRAYRAGKVGPHLAVAEDHAFYLDACLSLYEATFEEEWIEEALTTARAAQDLFGDGSEGGFFTTGSDAEALVVRAKDLFDNAIPSANSAMAYALTRLGLLTTDDAWLELAEGCFRAARKVLERAPLGAGHLLLALGMHTAPAIEIAIAGHGGSGDDLVDLARKTFVPYRVLAATPGNGTVVGLLKDKPALDGRTTAYVCERGICSKPVTTREELLELIGR